MAYTTLSALSERYGITRFTLWHRVRARAVPYKKSGRDLLIPLTHIAKLTAPVERKAIRKHPLYDRWRKIMLHPLTCNEWTSFEQFTKDVGDKPEGATALMRIESSIGWQPGNTVWL